jgi:hypothetical protein
MRPLERKLRAMSKKDLVKYALGRAEALRREREEVRYLRGDIRRAGLEVGPDGLQPAGTAARREREQHGLPAEEVAAA